MTNYATIHSNNLQDVVMIAGDERKFNYYVYTHTGAPMNLYGTSASIIIFRYGEPTTIIADITGSQVIVSGSTNLFTITFSGSGMPEGIYQQQVKIRDAHGGIHYPAQGRIIVFPSPVSTSEYYSD